MLIYANRDTEVKCSAVILIMIKNDSYAYHRVTYATPLNGVHPKIYPFNTCHIIRVNKKVVSQLSQPIFFHVHI